MKQDLTSIYEQNYLKPQFASQVIQETKGEETEEEDTAPTPKVAGKKKKKPFDAGACYAEKRSFNQMFETFMEEFESGDNAFDDTGVDDSFDFDDNTDGEEQSFTVSELKGMTLGEIVDLLSGDAIEDNDVGGDEFSFDGGEDDDIPTESYGQMGDGKHLGNSDTRDGKPKKQPASTRVKANGDADFSKQETGFAPEDTEGSEGSHLGNTDTRDGKPKKQAPSTHVNSNGTAKVGQSQRTGHGKKEGERLF